ncbi:bifunctional 5,10-methylenetetrahydrofolate dehydrogenase/5,10-methenyltetrahydrofolate cyclohydrolase [candidate division WWE3 bacterium]|uniref:Bifunctional protein FolD n=1 Tax=candidate division WWE3 bacterium TaxID=2053526 RepID=A0A955LWG2_UNCKA|nr:bifunctional 5,10-methylenetetrahydrofolate dehydrogenase/5,10-methenyltetrahydrofolate cyclohydrolase [candidate division WWE3 bacterium]
METTIYNGKERAREIETDLAQRVSVIQNKRKHAPGLLSILIGDDPASHAFISIKEKRAQAIGINFERKHYPETFDPIKVVRYIHSRNEDTSIDGILIQLPLPPQFDRTATLKAIHPYKDVDGLHPKNLGFLIEGKAHFVPPAVLAVNDIVRQANLKLSGKEVVLVGSGLLVGKPLAMYFVNEGATVTMCSIHTTVLSRHTKRADIIISSTGEADLITPEMVKEGVVSIDFGGKKINGVLKGEFSADVAFKSSLFTPVPGGIGPMTVAKLLENTVISAERSLG